MSLESLPDEELLDRWNTTVEDEARTAILQVLQKKGLFPSSFVDSWENDTGAYPEYDDPRFLKKLLGKREFAESYQSTWVPTSDPCSDDGNFETTAVQRFVANLMSPRSPYMSALLYHGVGVGKTCAAVQISEAWLEAYPEDRVFLIAPPTIQEGFLRTIFDVNRLTLGSSEEGHEAEPNTLTGCTGTTYLELTGTLLERDPERIKRKVQQAINRRYNIMGYITFANYIDNLLQGIDVTLSGEERAAKMRDVLRRHFSNKIIIIDEAHNLRDVVGEVLVGTGPGGGDEKETAEAGKQLTRRLQMVLDAAEGLKLVLLTATPMYNNYLEIISLMNLLLRNDKKALLTEGDLFLPKGKLRPATKTHPGGAALIGQVARRYISYMRGENPVSFPIRLSPEGEAGLLMRDRPYPPENPKGEAVSPSSQEFVQHLPLVAIELTGDSLAASESFRSALKPGPTELTSMDIEKLIQAGNFIAPATASTAEPTYENFRRRTEMDGIEQILQKIGSQEVQYKARTPGGASWLAAATLGQYSPKFVFLLKRLATCEGVAFVYSRFVGAGALPLALALEANGYTLAPGGEFHCPCHGLDGGANLREFPPAHRDGRHRADSPEDWKPGGPVQGPDPRRRLLAGGGHARQVLPQIRLFVEPAGYVRGRGLCLQPVRGGGGAPPRSGPRGQWLHARPGRGAQDPPSGGRHPGRTGAAVRPLCQAGGRAHGDARLCPRLLRHSDG